MYFDEAVTGLEAQLKDLKKAQKFIFMEYHAIEDAEADVYKRQEYNNLPATHTINRCFHHKYTCPLKNPPL